jgi:hypothetical protein
VVDSTPSVPVSAKISPEVPAIKIATPDIMIYNDQSFPVELMTDLIFEDIGGQEIINIARNDTINGQSVLYSPIKNLSSINSENNSNNILGVENTSLSYFKNFPIKLETHTPQVGTGPAPDYSIVYIDPKTGNLIINVINMESDEQVEIQILVTGDILDDTIY